MTLLADAVVLETKERKGLALSSRDHPSVPALKVARLAVQEAFRATYAGAGTALLQIAHAVALDIANRVGCRLLTLDAYPAARANGNCATVHWRVDFPHLATAVPSRR